MLMDLALWVGSWSIITGGQWKLFERVEKGASDGLKEKLKGWIEGVRAEGSVREIASSFDQAFIAFFGRRHFSKQCLARSIATSYVLAVALYLAMHGISSNMPVLAFTDLPGFLAATALFNLAPDYISLWKSRVLLRRTDKTRVSRLVFAVALDIFVSIAISMVFVTFVRSLIGISMGTNDGTPWTFAMPLLISVRALWSTDRWDLYLTMWTYVTLFTSIWVVLFTLSGMLLRFEHSINRGWSLLQWSLNFEKQPFSLAWSMRDSACDATLRASGSTGHLLLVDPTSPRF